MTGFATNIAEAFEGAIDILDRRGWCQKTGVNDHQEVCAEEAIGQACGLPHGWWSAVYRPRDARHELALTAINFHWVSFRYVLAAWNDAPGRTPAEVRDRLMQCAKLAREEGV